MTERAAGRYLLTGEKFDATVAAEIGLITAAVDDLDTATAELYDQLRKCSPGLAETKPLTTRATREAIASRAADLAALLRRHGCSAPTRPARACSHSWRSARPVGFSTRIYKPSWAMMSR